MACDLSNPIPAQQQMKDQNRDQGGRQPLMDGDPARTWFHCDQKRDENKYVRHQFCFVRFFVLV